MAKKIILYLSAYNPNNTTPAAYECPVGGPVEGVQTNDAPVKYLLREHPDISEITLPRHHGGGEESVGAFSGSCGGGEPKVQCHPIFIPDGKDFAQDILPEVISKTQKDDEIFLETTGGFRDAVMYLLLISRALSYAGVRSPARCTACIKSPTTMKIRIRSRTPCRSSASLTSSAACRRPLPSATYTRCANTTAIRAGRAHRSAALGHGRAVGDHRALPHGTASRAHGGLQRRHGPERKNTPTRSCAPCCPLSGRSTGKR